ncbi:hypothetical protein [Azospirillum argentinense]|uniref:hypothetical protein n=1 Tax=Azospirillum argentinense TaxID=2970906 RepID=UPI00200041EF|nr:hypothetical protein [Azospirillum argentinense]
MVRDDGLEVFQDLLLRGAAEGRPQLRKALIELAVGPWWHAANDENVLSEHAGPGEEIIAFHRDPGDGLKAVGLVLWSEPEGFKVTNIVPRDVGELGIANYNWLLQDFIERLARPAAARTGFSVEVTAARQRLKDWMSSEAADALRRFSAAANKSTGSSHPLDRRRWLAFLMSAHRDATALDAEQLVRWLTEVEGWPGNVAHRLAVEYEFGRELLTTYDQFRS